MDLAVWALALMVTRSQGSSGCSRSSGSRMYSTPSKLIGPSRLVLVSAFKITWPRSTQSEMRISGGGAISSAAEITTWAAAGDSGASKAI